MAPVSVLPAGWGHDVTSHVGGASMGRPVSTIVRKVLSNVISFIMPTILAVSLDCAITTRHYSMPTTVSEWGLMSAELWQV